MTIISISIIEELLIKLDKFEKESEYSGRSDVIRAALQSFLAEQQTQTELKGQIDGVLTLLHKDNANATVSELRHKHEEIIKTQVHHHLEEDKCLEILIIKGQSNKVQELIKDCQRKRNIHLVKFIKS